MVHQKTILSRARAQGNAGFTLIELLVVIAIVAILAVAVVVALNPAQLLRQARDSNRIGDMASLKSALQLYLADVQFGAFIGTSSICYASATSVPATGGCGGRMAGSNVTTSTPIVNARRVDGAGWIRTNFTQISAGSPLSNEPLDPVNNATYFYSYATNAAALTFEINADMESVKYTNGGSGDVESKDGGDHNTTSSAVFEVGTAPGLTL